MEDYLELAVDLALSQGASYAEARYQLDRYESNLLKNGIPDVTSFETKKGIAVRVVVDGALGFGATNRLTKKDVRGIVRSAALSAKQASKLRKTPVRMAPAEMGQERVEVKTRVGFDALGTESRMELMKEADRAVVGSVEGLGMKLPGRYLSLDTSFTEKIIVNSDGARVRSLVPKVMVDAILTAFDPQKGSVQRIISLGESSGWEAVERWDLPRRLEEEGRTLGLILKEGEAFKGERCDVILGPEVVGIVSHESSGHPGEADRMLGREAAQAGETYLQRDSIGMKVGSEAVSVAEDPTIPHSFGFYLYDDEGVKARKRWLIKEGRIDEFLHNRETASVFGIASNASSRSVAYNREPIVRMANTFVEPGDHTVEELFEAIQSGVYIKNFMEWNIDDRRFNQKYVGLEAYRIVNGELGPRIRNPIIEITTIGLWSSVDAVGKKMEFSAATCGKGDPMQGAPVWTGGPDVRLRNVLLGGSG